MKALLPSSLGGRLIVGLMLFTLVTLAVTLFVMDRVLDHFVTGQIDQRLDNKLVSLASQVRLSADGTISLEGDADGPPFDEARHKSFWRVAGPRNAIESRWLPPGALVPPTPAEIAAVPARPPPPGALGNVRPRPRPLRMLGPGGVPTYMRVVMQTFGATSITILAAAPVEAINAPVRSAMSTLASAILVLGLASLLAAFSLVRLSLRPLAQLRRDITDVRTGRCTALRADQPMEIKPLVEELNSLLAQNAANLVRARKHVANLAHSLKTPLATLSLGVGRLENDQGVGLQPLVDAIEQRVRYHLGRARSAALEGPVRVRTPLRARLVDIFDALQKIYAEKRVTFVLDCPADLALACEPQDVDEILGNLLDNAFKYTRSHVTCTARRVAAAIVVDIEDDGPGLQAEEIDRMLRRGERLDEQVLGFGFGLPIARELAELYAGEIALVPNERGLLVQLTLPGAR